MKNLLFVFLILSFLSCKEHSVEPVVHTSSNIVYQDTIKANVIILETDTGNQTILSGNSIRIKTGYGAEVNLYCTDNGLLLDKGLYAMQNIYADGIIASKAVPPWVFDSLVSKVANLEKKISELESKLR